MQISARVALAISVAMATTLTVVPAAVACSCGPPPPVSAAVERAGAVFEGKVIAGPEPTDERQVLYRFEVLRSWKGSPGAEVTVRTPAHGSACGRSFAEGTTWLLYPYANEAGELNDNICSRSMVITKAEEDLAELGEAPPVTAGTTEPEATEGATTPEPSPQDEASATDAEPVEPAPTTEPEPATEEAPADEPATAAEAAPPEPDDEVVKKPGCSVSGGGPSGVLLLVLVAGLLRRRRG